MSATSVHHSQSLRNTRARDLLNDGAVQPVTPTHFVFAAWVHSQSVRGVRYYVTLGPESCSCPDYHHHGSPHVCKHIMAARFFYLRQTEMAQ